MLGLILELAYKEGDFTLASGKKSDYYVDLRLVTMHQRGSLLTGILFFDAAKEALADNENVGITGMTMGADPIITATALVAELEGNTLHPFYTRKEAKGHGTGRALEGYVEPVKAAFVVEDVSTTGGSALKTVEFVREARIEPLSVIVLLDRMEGARENVKAAGLPFEPIFTIEELGRK
ncbi:MAG: orotate phosphoribosyltransferase [Candidatus Coatesbacteria bacterium]|nr:MAG: orotate phosphoribosyltransferase [Candidatus Coatesbacteria bacterium]